MHVIRIRKTLDSDTLHLPELLPLLGRTVEITINEECGLPSGFIAGNGDWHAFQQAAAAALRNRYDFEAICNQDECDWKHAHEASR